MWEIFFSVNYMTLCQKLRQKKHVALTAIFCSSLPCDISIGVLVCTAVHLGSSGNHACITDKLSLAGKTLVCLDLVQGQYPETVTLTNLA